MNVEPCALWRCIALVPNAKPSPYVQIALEYRFLSRAINIPMDARLSVTLYYEDDEQYYVSNFFNETLTYTGQGGVVGARRVAREWAPFALGAAVTLAGLYLVAAALGLRQMVSRMLRPAPKARGAAAPAAAGAEDDGFASPLSGANRSANRKKTA